MNCPICNLELNIFAGRFDCQNDCYSCSYELNKTKYIEQYNFTNYTIIIRYALKQLEIIKYIKNNEHYSVFNAKEVYYQNNVDNLPDIITEDYVKKLYKRIVL